MSNYKVSKEVYDEFLRLLSNIRSAPDLDLSERKFSCLVSELIRNDPGLSQIEALKKVLSNILDLVAEERSEFADVLKGRFWEGLKVNEMLETGRPWPVEERRQPRTFLNIQKKAVEAFAFWFLEKENACKKQQENSFTPEKRLETAKGVRNTLSEYSRENSISPRRINKKNASIIFVLFVIIISASFLLKNRFISTLCYENTSVEDASVEERFVPSQGVTIFSKENTPVGIINNRIRAVFGTPRGVIIGYFGNKTGATNGVTYYNKVTKMWAQCGNKNLLADKVVNSIFVDRLNNIWVATDGNGVLRFNGVEWEIFNPDNSGLPNVATYNLTEDQDGNIWVGTGHGLAVFEDGLWATPYKHELFHNQVYTVAFDNSGNIWVGHISEGVSVFNNIEGKWEWIRAGEGKLNNNNIRGIVVRKENEGESVWFATAGGGVSRLWQGEWKSFSLRDGLPSLQIADIEVDNYGRIWIATDKGVAYFDGIDWRPYNTLNTLSISIGPACPDNSCPEDNRVWTGTEANGLTESRLPYAEEVIEISRICFTVNNDSISCPQFTELQIPHVVTVTNPISLDSGDEFYYEIYVTPKNGHELVLNEARGDHLRFLGESEEELYGAYPIVPVEGTVATGQTFIFSNRQNVFLAPELAEEHEEMTYVSRWRIWMFNRYAGPQINIVFKVVTTGE